jgi:hypothetical protein
MNSLRRKSTRYHDFFRRKILQAKKFSPHHFLGSGLPLDEGLPTLHGGRIATWPLRGLSQGLSLFRL